MVSCFPLHFLHDSHEARGVENMSDIHGCNHSGLCLEWQMPNPMWWLLGKSFDNGCTGSICWRMKVSMDHRHQRSNCEKHSVTNYKMTRSGQTLSLLAKVNFFIFWNTQLLQVHQSNTVWQSSLNCSIVLWSIGYIMSTPTVLNWFTQSKEDHLRKYITGGRSSFTLEGTLFFSLAMPNFISLQPVSRATILNWQFTCCLVLIG